MEIQKSVMRVERNESNSALTVLLDDPRVKFVSKFIEFKLMASLYTDFVSARYVSKRTVFILSGPVKSVEEFEANLHEQFKDTLELVYRWST